MLGASQHASVAGGPLGPSSYFISTNQWKEVLGRREKQGSLLADWGCQAEVHIKALSQRWRLHSFSLLVHMNMPVESRVSSASHTGSVGGARRAYILTG